jgi:hypothetical protein
MIIIYFDPSKPLTERYGFHVYRPGWIYDKEQSKADFPSREVAYREARKLAARHDNIWPGHEIFGGAEFIREPFNA